MPFVRQSDSVKTNATLAEVKVGSGLLIDQYGVLSVTPELEVGGGGGSGDSVSKSFNVTGHGFIVGNVIARSTGAWILANAASDTTAEVAGVVSAVADADNFTLTFVGYISGLSGLSEGTTYFLSTTVSGDVMATSPTATNTVSKPVYIAISGTEAIVLQSRGVVN